MRKILSIAILCSFSLILATLFSFTLCFYVNKNLSVSTNKQIINNFRIYNEHNLNNNFLPQNFTIDYEIDKKIYNKKFSRIEKEESDSVGRNKIFSLTENGIRSVEIDHEQKYDLYREINGNSIATLIKNEISPNSNSKNKFRMIASITEEESPHIYTIIPVNHIQDGLIKENFDHAQNSHVIFKRDAREDDFEIGRDYLEIDENIFEEDEKILLNGRKMVDYKIIDQPKANQDIIDLNIEILVVTDVSIYQDHQIFSGSNDSNLIFLHMAIYYSHVINMMNLRFQNTFVNNTQFKISLKLLNYLFLTDTKYCDWANPSLVGVSGYPTYKGRPVISDGSSLSSFRVFINNMRSSLPFAFDHAIGFYDKDLWSDSTNSTPADKSRFVGWMSSHDFISLTYRGGICLDYTYTVLEDRGSFENIKRFTHEIGHALGGYHDGAGGDPYNYAINCKSADNYALSATQYIQSSINLINQHKFSNCSIQSFIRTIFTDLTISKIRAQGLCLIENANKTSFSKKAESYKNPGHSWTADDQCKIFYGQNASFCHFTSASMCLILGCRINETETNCTYLDTNSAAVGTTCDSGKSCFLGNCINDSSAPIGDCIFGDDVVVNEKVIQDLKLPTAQMSCDDVIEFVFQNDRFGVAYCYSNSIFKKTCCKTCQKYSNLSCVDYDPNCPLMQSNCSELIIQRKCPRTCKQCSITPLNCSTFPCQNNGICVNIKNISSDTIIGYQCNCSDGYEGYQCEKVNPCIPTPCSSNQTCLRLGSLGYICKNNSETILPCSYGLPCLFQRPSDSPPISNEIANLPAILGGAIGGFFILVILGVVAFAIIKRKRIKSFYDKTYYNKPYASKNYSNEKQVANDKNEYSETVINSMNNPYNLEPTPSGYDYLYSEVPKLKQKTTEVVSNEPNSLENVTLDILNENNDALRTSINKTIDQIT